MSKIKISFLETEILSLNRSGDGIKGYEPAIIETEKGIFKGRVIDTDRLKKAKQVHHEFYSTNIDLKDVSFDLSLLLETTEKGQSWFDNFKRYFYDYFKEEIPMNLSIKKLDFPFGANYTLYPDDVDLIGKLSYECPKGKIISLSDGIVYHNLLPPMKFNNGKFIPNIYYNRKVDDIEGFFNSYSIQDPTRKYYSVEGCLLGNLKLNNLEINKGDFRNSFPMPHFLEVVYPITIRDNNHNPLSIRFELV